MEAVFSRFLSYDFHSDGRFQEGLKSLQQSSRDESKELDMKLFFYNRFVEPIDRSSYKQWSAARCRVNGQTDSEELDQRTLSQSESGVSDCQAAETSAETETPPLSFAEVMRLVQEGKEVPGVTKVDVKPTNDDPTPSNMERRLKPWEVSASK